MDIEELERLIANDENVHLELKKTTGELKDGMHTACAFLNGAGGWLVFEPLSLLRFSDRRLRIIHKER